MIDKLNFQLRIWRQISKSIRMSKSATDMRKGIGIALEQCATEISQIIDRPITKW